MQMYNQGKIMRRLLGRTADATTDTTLGGVNSSPIPPSYRPSTSQSAEYTCGVPIACIDRAPDGQTAVLGGRHVLKTVRIDGSNIKEGIDIRALITAQYTNRPNASSSISEQLSIRDVKWASNSNGDSTIFTACANGKIFQYDVARLGPGLDYVQMREDSRQVNKLDVNPHRGNWLLSGGQDGIVRCFDVKAPVNGRNGLTFKTFQAFRCNAESVRDIKWSPKEGVIFACATESGAVFKWDIRKATAPLLKINAHDTQKGATSISWHPDGDHLVSGGFDSKCFVWDLSSKAEKRQKPKWSISAPAPVTVVAWRPALWSATAQGKRAAQIAVSYDDGGNHRRHGISAVHIWDLARPTMPFKEIDRFINSPQALLWHDQDLLWTAGSDGLFTQCALPSAQRVIERQPLSVMDFSAQGDVLMFLEERVHPTRSRLPMIVNPETMPNSISSSPTGQVLSISRSDSEEDVMGSFLGPKRRSSRKRRTTSRPPQSLSTTPPSGPGISDDQVIPLDQAMRMTGTFKPQQVMAIGKVPAISTPNVYQFLSTYYLETLAREMPFVEGAKPLNERMSNIMERYAHAAESVNQYRLAQTWRILAFAMDILLVRRSQYHLETRTASKGKKKSPLLESEQAKNFMLSSLTNLPYHHRVGGEETPKKAPSVSSESRYGTGRSLLAEEIESTSNVPTPLARPVADTDTEGQDPNSKRLSPVREIESFALPPPAQPRQSSPRKRLDSVPLSIDSQDSQISSTEGYDFYDTVVLDALPSAIDVPNPRKKEPLSLDFVGPQTPNSRSNAIKRYDSDESFPQMFSVSDGTRQTAGIAGSSGADAVKNGAQMPSSATNPGSVEEFQSRIRGHQMADSPDRIRHDKRPDSPSRTDSGSSREREIFMISQTTEDNTIEAYASQQSDSLTDSHIESQPESHEDSTSLRFHLTAPTSPTALRKTSQERAQERVQPPQSQSPPARPEDQTAPDILETDFLPWPLDPPYPFPLASGAPKQPSPPLDPYDLIARALDFEARRSALNASAMVLLFGPLVPPSLIDTYQATAILRQQHRRLMGMKLFVEAALLRNLCVRDWLREISDWGENYPSVFSQAQDRVSVGLSCSNCHKPREIDRSKTEGPGVWKCERCRAVMAPCAVCGHRDTAAVATQATPLMSALSSPTLASNRPGSPFKAPDSDSVLSTWWYCPGCQHGGHSSCLAGWHAPVHSHHSPSSMDTGPDGYLRSAVFNDGLYPETYSDGCCPLDGCGHACLPGRWRDESVTLRTEELGRVVREQTRTAGTPGGKNERRVSNSDTGSLATSVSTSVGIRGDSMEVAQSRAVDSVRDVLSAGSSGGFEREGRPGGILSVLSASPGRGSSVGADVREGGERGRERRKSVKFGGVEERR